MKKKFLPAALRIWRDRWMIVFYQIHPESGERIRFSRSYDINRIKSKKIRRKRAQEIIDELNNEWLPQGYPYMDPVVYTSLENTNIREAILFAASCKATNRKATTAAYQYTANKFIQFLMDTDRGELGIIQLDKKIVTSFLDWIIITKKMSPVSHNNLGSKMGSICQALQEREYIRDNPFKGFRRLAEEEKERRPLSSQEKKIISSAIRRKDKRLYLAINILYYCFIRKTEMLRLKFRHFDFKINVIRIPGGRSKNKKSQIVTIPNHLADLMVSEYDFLKYPGHWLIFGKKMMPSAWDTCSRNTPTSRHRKIVDSLERAGQISDGKGIVFYSWKDTGAWNMLRKGIDIRKIQKQLRHTSLETTQRYLQQLDDKIEDISEMDGDI